MSKAADVAVMAFPFASHPGIVFGLVRRLAVAAPNVTFTFCNTSKSNAKLFIGATSEIPSNIKRFDVPDGVHVPSSGSAFAGNNLEEEVEMFLKVAPENLRIAVADIEKSSGGKVGCIIGDAFMWFCGDVAAEMGVPYVPLWTAAAAPFSLHLITDFIRQTLGHQGIAGREDEIVTFIPGFPELRIGDIPMEIVSGNFDDSPFAVMLHNMGRAVERATIILINSVEELDSPIINHLKKRYPNILNIGPLNLTSNNLDDNHNCISWLDNQTEKSSVAYIAFGTVTVPPPNELKAIAEALEEGKTPFIWALGDKFTSHLPKGFLERTMGFGKIVPWAPQVKVLEHASIGVFISHCGWSSVQESITAGVPIICRPFFGDQPINSWMIEKVWRIGMKIDGGVFTKNGTMHALELALSHDTGDTLKTQVELYKEIVQRAVGQNGSSTKSFNTLSKVVTGGNFNHSS